MNSIKRILVKIVSSVTTLIVVAFLCLMLYGIKHQCKNVAVQNFCGVYND